jgi:hypothetical protein
MFLKLIFSVHISSIEILKFSCIIITRERRDIYLSRGEGNPTIEIAKRRKNDELNDIQYYIFFNPLLHYLYRLIPVNVNKQIIINKVTD